MALERKWLAIDARLLTADGTTFGLVQVVDTVDFRTKMKVGITSDTQQPIQLQVKEVLSPTMMILGLASNPQLGPQAGIDLTAFKASENAFVRAPEQDKNQIPDKDHYLAVYEADPVVADRVILVDEYGRKIGKDNGLVISSVQLQNIEQILVQGFLNNAQIFLTNENLENLYDEDGRILTE